MNLPTQDDRDREPAASGTGQLTIRERRAALKNKIRRRGIYVLPNLFTLAALFFGFFGIVQAMNLRFDYAAVSVFVAMVLDSLDEIGRAHV